MMTMPITSTNDVHPTETHFAHKCIDARTWLLFRLHFLFRKRFFQNMLERYRKGMIPLSVPLHILRSYVVVFESEYLFRQTFLDPNPSSLLR
nr:DUF1722 domain-containing protein [Mesotoga sp. TolDC]